MMRCKRQWDGRTVTCTSSGSAGRGSVFPIPGTRSWVGLPASTNARCGSARCSAKSAPRPSTPTTSAIVGSTALLSRKCWRRLMAPQCSRETDFIVTKPLDGYRVKRVDRAIIATVITAAMVALAASSVLNMLNAALLATIAMLATGCLTSKQAFNSVQWKTVVVLGAALGLEAAVTGSGLSQTIAKLCADLGSDSPRLGLAVIFAGTIIMTNVISNVATAAFMFPVALSMSEMLGVSFKPFVMVLMVAASCAFVNPAGFQTNLMVQKDGGYSFADFARVGLPLTILVGIVVLLVAPIAYGF